MSRSRKISSYVKPLFPALIFFLASAAHAQEAYVLLGGENILDRKELEYSKKIDISITPRIVYEVDENNKESLTIQFLTKWYINNDLYRQKNERVFIINDPEVFKKSCETAGFNWKYPKKIKDDISVKTIELLPPGTMQYELNKNPQVLSDTNTIRIGFLDFSDQAITLNVTFYLGVDNSFTGFEVQERAKTLTWQFKRPPPSDRSECRDKLAQYLEKFDSYNPRQKMEKFAEIAKSGVNKPKAELDKIKKELDSYKTYNKDLNIFKETVEQDIAILGCENLKVITQKIDEYFEFYNENNYQINDLGAKAKVKLDSINASNSKSQQSLESISGKDAPGVRDIYRNLKKLQWRFQETGKYDSVQIAGIGSDLEALKKENDDNFSVLEETKSGPPEMQLMKADFESYYQASKQVIASFTSGGGDQAIAGAKGKKESGKTAKWKKYFKIGYIIPIVLLIGLILLFKFYKPARKFFAIGKKVKSKT